jgi:hypothetical protein
MGRGNGEHGMPGITRINIISTWNDWRVRLAADHSIVANKIYREIFNLDDGDENIKCTKDEATARYDWKEGIDVILTTVNKTRMTLQEKFLTFNKNTATFEEKKTSGEDGAWYYCTAQYYFVGYTRKYWNYKERKLCENPVIDFQNYILIDLAALHREDEKNILKWNHNKNKYDGRGSTFRFIYFNDIPVPAIITRR